MRATAVTPDGGGYWLAAADGGVLTGGDAAFYGSTAGRRLSAPVVAMAATPDGGGYWLAAADGGVMTFGDAGFFGSAAKVHLAAPIVAMAATPDGAGYWLVGSDGGVLSYGDAPFAGSAGGLHLAAPITAFAPTPDGLGYWLAGADGGVMTFGDAGFFGSARTADRAAPIGAMAATPDGGGYWLVGWDGGVLTYGDAPFLGAALGHSPVSAAASGPGFDGYLLAAADGTVVSTRAETGASPGTTSPHGIPAPSGPAAPAGPTVVGNEGWTPTAADPGYTLLYPDGSGGTRARWNPCAAIRWAVNLSDAPANALSDAQQAVAQVSAATGIPFTYAGTTDTAPNPSGPGGQLPAGIDAVIAWLPPSDFAVNATEAGFGGNWWAPATGPTERIYQGYAIVNGDLASGFLHPGFGPGYSEGHLLLHELGHMMGLGHTADPSEVMTPQQGPLSSAAYGPGDLQGLRVLGAGPCV
ncbi:MAG TPA: hypothetical protein VFH50_00355 [Acidimicrobiales bacterium]|nr:hypothetical protein [Acidimicrobiales bacterium]